MRRSLCFLLRGFDEGREDLILVMVFPRKRQNSENSLRLGERVAQTNKTISCLLRCPLPSMDNSMVASSVLAAFVVSSAVVLQVQVGTKTAGQLRCQRRNDGGNARRRDTVSVAGPTTGTQRQRDVD